MWLNKMSSACLIQIKKSWVSIIYNVSWDSNLILMKLFRLRFLSLIYSKPSKKPFFFSKITADFVLSSELNQKFSNYMQDLKILVTQKTAYKWNTTVCSGASLRVFCYTLPFCKIQVDNELLNFCQSNKNGIILSGMISLQIRTCLNSQMMFFPESVT